MPVGWTSVKANAEVTYENGSGDAPTGAGIAIARIVAREPTRIRARRPRM